MNSVFKEKMVDKEVFDKSDILSISEALSLKIACQITFVRKCEDLLENDT